MKLHTIIQEFIHSKNISIRELARRSGLSNSYLARIVSGEDTNPSLEAVRKLASAMGMSSKDLFNILDEDQSSSIHDVMKMTTSIPLFENISCGKGLFINEQPEDYIAVPDRFINPNAEYFANIASGDSMTGKDIKDGDVLVFEKTNVLENGQIGSFCVDDENYCKVFRKLPDGTILLESANDQYDPVIVNIHEQCFRIIGKYKFKFSVEQ
ncbi:MAG: helix-turn-helix domain-containing protein [Erysipelotrichaceae bacterium]|nr:helix-turn-helix domain-containing protein [Erysipelotrichaceae bacterium]